MQETPDFEIGTWSRSIFCGRIVHVNDARGGDFLPAVALYAGKNAKNCPPHFGEFFPAGCIHPLQCVFAQQAIGATP
jgi:hypothetical protein